MRSYKFRNPKPLGLVICALAAAFGMTVLASIGILAYLHGLLAHPLESLSETQRATNPSAWFDLERKLTHGTAWIDLDQALSKARVLLFLTNSVLFLIWIRQTVANIWAIEKNDFGVTPGWAVAWFFIPLANYVMTYMVVRELWEESHALMEPEDHEMGVIPIPPVLSCWLLSFLAYVAFGVGRFFAVSGHPSVATVLRANSFTLVSLALLFIALFFFVHIIWRVSSLHAAYR